MRDTALNPFNITKAVDFSDQEIADYWVDISAGDGFAAITKPASPMPMLILGGKGSGKTHLMRYFSYPLQRIRHGDDVFDGIKRDKYIGVYLRCGGLNATRFRDKGQSGETWAEVFAYYMELWLSQLVLGTVLDIVEPTVTLKRQEQAIVKEISAFIRGAQAERPVTLRDVCKLLQRRQQELDDAVNNSSISGKLPVHIDVTRGDLVFGIPKILAAKVAAFRSCLFMYLIDEFENLSEVQQKYVNTLLRERRNPCSFKIGARMYGVRTFSTYSADEENKEGSEFEVLRLDSILRNNNQYGRFARRLVAKRLAEFDRTKSTAVTLGSMTETLDGCFAEPERSKFATVETAYVIEKYKSRERPYFDELRDYLRRGLAKKVAPGIGSGADIEKVVALLRSPEYPLLEKANLLLFYQDWRSGRNLIAAAREISDACSRYVKEKPKAERYKEGLAHFKGDLIAQLYRETDQRQKYLGISTFIEISSGLPRNLLIVLKHIFAWATFNGEKPFRGPQISERAQQAGVLEASEWFYRDAKMMGADGKVVMDSIEKLGTLFRSIRFSKKPAECSCSTFSTDLSTASEHARRVLHLAENWSLLINVGQQRDRNTKRIDAKYQLNPMLAPRWDLSIYRRGALALTPAEVNAVFDPSHGADFDRLAKKRIDRMTPPSFGRTTGERLQEEPTLRLFDEDNVD